MPYTLGKPGCPKCKGDGVTPGEPITIERVSGPPKVYPTVIRCSCLEKSVEDLMAEPEKSKADMQRRAAGEKDS